MKVVKDKAALNKMALATGGTVTDESGNKFNQKGIKSKPEKKLEPLPKSKKSPPPAIPDTGITKLAESVSDSGKATVMMLAELKTQMERMHNGAQAEQVLITEWKFGFERDDKGYILEMTARAYSYGKALTAQTKH